MSYTILTTFYETWHGNPFLFPVKCKFSISLFFAYIRTKIQSGIMEHFFSFFFWFLVSGWTCRLLGILILILRIKGPYSQKSILNNWFFNLLTFRNDWLIRYRRPPVLNAIFNIRCFFSVWRRNSWFLRDWLNGA